MNSGIGYIKVIDNTTDVSRIATLKNQKSIRIAIALPEIPIEFKDFTHTESLHIETSADLSKLDLYFPNLKHLNIVRSNRKSIANKKFQFDSLRSLYIMRAKNLENMDAFSNCRTIEKLMLRGTPNLIHFPKFHRKNNIKEVIIDHGVTFRKKETANYLKNLKRLSKLENLTLANIYSLTEVPSYLPKSIQYLEINSWALHDHTTKIKSLKHLKKYTNLKFLKLYKIELAPIEDTFPEVSLAYLLLNTVYNLKDVSWIFTFQHIDKVQLYDCYAYTTISVDRNSDVVSEIAIDKADSLTSIESLFYLDNLKSLKVRHCPKLVVPSTDIMYKIPNLMMSGVGYRLYKSNGIWEQMEYD
ncbi:hypothetical protein [Kordia sp. SMS9]|uniref:hypothetical protein n=1 Tax=Kordia sp. SMS9 TaxID=2282170 RepID=UPI0019627C7D|nr:hypothetical protein [Kordia sp. SMS9]